MREKTFVIKNKKESGRDRIPFTVKAPVDTTHKFFCLLRVRGRLGGFPFRMITPSLNVYGITKVKHKKETKVSHKLLYTPEGVVPMRKESWEYRETFISLVKFEQDKFGRYDMSNKAVAFKQWEAIPEEIKEEVIKILTAEMQ